MSLFLTIKQLKNGWVNIFKVPLAIIGPQSSFKTINRFSNSPFLHQILFFLEQNLVILFKNRAKSGNCTTYLARFSNHGKLVVVLIEIVLTSLRCKLKLRPFDFLVWSDDFTKVQLKYILSIFEFFEFLLYISMMEFLIVSSSKVNFSAWNVQVIISLVTSSKTFLGPQKCPHGQKGYTFFI